MKNLPRRKNTLFSASRLIFVVSALGMIACRVAQHYAAVPPWVDLLGTGLIGVMAIALSGVLVGEASGESGYMRAPGRVIYTVLAVIELALGLWMLGGLAMRLMP